MFCHRGMHNHIAMLICIHTVLLGGSAQAFKPTNWLRADPSDASHESITEEALREVASDPEVYGSIPSRSLDHAIDQIGLANALVDLQAFSQEVHFDGEALEEGQARLEMLTESIKQALGKNSVDLARRELGRALHTLQDFYSHSNWVELGNSGHNTRLGRRGYNIKNPSGETCAPCDPSTTLLCLSCTQDVRNNELATKEITTGYFALEWVEPWARKPKGKCSHGGPSDRTAETESAGINKDSSLCSESPHGRFHFAAARAAHAATVQYLRDLKASVTLKQFRRLLGTGPSLAICIDTTSSMQPIIDAVREAAIRLVRALVANPDAPSQYVLVPFSDPTVGPITITADDQIFESAIRGLRAEGGGDCPELSMGALLKAVASTDPGGAVFLYTDASAKDAELQREVLSLARAKNVSISVLAYGDCGAFNQVYSRLTSATGGLHFSMTQTDIEEGARLSESGARSNVVTLLSINDALLGETRTYPVPVDSLVGDVSFTASGARLVAITRPDGTTVDLNASGVDSVILSDGANVNITSPPAGTFRVAVQGSGDFSLTVSGTSSLDLTKFRFSEIGGRLGHEGYFPIAGLPVKGRDEAMIAKMTPGYRSVRYVFRDMAGTRLGEVALEPGKGQAIKSFLGKATLPSGEFRVYVEGEDQNGRPFQRVMPAVISAQTVEVRPLDGGDAVPEVGAEYTFVVMNHGSLEKFVITARDDLGYVAEVSPSTLTLGSGESQNVTVRLVPSQNRPDAGATADTAGADPVIIGGGDTLVVTARGEQSGSENFAVVTVGIFAATTDSSGGCGGCSATDGGALGLGLFLLLLRLPKGRRRA